MNRHRSLQRTPRESSGRIRQDSKTKAILHTKAKAVCCSLCGAGPGMTCKSVLNHKPVRPHLERIMAWEAGSSDFVR